MAFPWNAEGIEARLTELWTAGELSAAKIAAELTAMTGEPLTRNAVIGRANRLGIVRRVQEQQDVPVSDHAADPVEGLAEPATVTPPSPGSLLTDLRIGQCRFPVTPHHALSHLFCADPVEKPGATYCPHHAAMCFDRRTPQERRADYDRAARARAGREAA